jgi:hypothetical protein
MDWTFVKDKKAFEEWHTRGMSSIIEHLEKPKNYPCFVKITDTPHGETTNDVLYESDIYEMVDTYLKFRTDLPNSTSGASMPQCKPPKECAHRIIFNKKCAWCGKQVKP